ncbi:MAG TPA: cytochrome P460 family protein [Tepidisphaeraceae bacterium]|jgi:hypothetical protein|nr:cytochrome P460 family protein [Tepidisphaeraceae bacterium]
MHRSIPFGVLLAALALGCDAVDKKSDAPKSDVPNVADVARNYKQLQAMTKGTVFADPGLAMQCSGVSQEQVEAARKKNGPHAHTELAIYMNDLAANAFRKSLAAYPVGSIIVKEKKGQTFSIADENDNTWKYASTPSGVGGMIKRAPGFDAKNGDWEYFYFEDPAKIESGKIATCVQCHAGAASKDHVFGNWAKPQSLDVRAD